ncbi:MAG: hypothetical protein PHH12_00570 [Candidatus Shapirobacteria bacterium]|nr:hypothetical protein [Candidatus Shapirobacteria bacterium]
MKKKSFFSLDLPDKIFGIEKSFLLLFWPPLVLLILFLISLNLILLPKINEIGDINNKTDQTKSNTIKIKEQNKYLSSIDQEKLKLDAEYLDNAVLKDKKSYLLVQIIRGVADKFGYQLESFSLAPGNLKEDEEATVKVSSSGETIKMPVSLSMIGPKDKNLDLVSALEKTLPILFIDEFEVKGSGELSELKLTVFSYYINDKVEMETDNLTLNDLILSDDESKLIDKISTFNKIETNQDENENTEFKKYNRENPFSF